MDKLVAKIVGLGVPGLVLLFAISSVGVAGAAAIVASLALLGGPFGMLGGIGTLCLLVLISDGITKYGFENIYKSVIKGLLQKGESKKSIFNKIEKYPISKGLKLKLKDYLENK